MNIVTDMRAVVRVCAAVFFVAGIFFGAPAAVHAATLKVSPDTGVYTAGATFSVRVVVNTQGQSINAAEGEISYNPSDLSVVSISKAGSIFTLWTREPEFSNGSGRISFGGGSPAGYSGSAGTVMTVTFKTKHEGTANVTYAVGSILAADGRGTNILSGMQGGAYTIQAASALPQPEYVPPANTPGAPRVSSPTHPDEAKWYKDSTAKLSWDLPSGVVAIRTLVDQKKSSIPTKVYEEPIRELTLTELPQGESYFHIQLKNGDGWGRVTHYRLAVDTEAPRSFTIEEREGNDPGNPVQKLHFAVDDAASGVSQYEITIDQGEKISFADTERTGNFDTPPLTPGSHTIVVTAIDAAGNSSVATKDLVVTAFGAPVFTEYAATFPASVIPVVRGTTKPDARVTLTLVTPFEAPRNYEVTADKDGIFTFIPEGKLPVGVYELYARAYDTQGAQSEQSETIRFAVQEPGVVRVFGVIVDVLSVVIPLLALIFVLVVSLWYGVHKMRALRRRLVKEVSEAEQSLAREMRVVLSAVEEHALRHREVRKNRISKEEHDSLEMLLEEVRGAGKRVKKELDDVATLLEHK